MMTGLDRYILRQCLNMMLFVTAALSAAVWLAQSLRLVDLIVNRGLSAEVFAYLAALLMPRLVHIVLPIGAFIAVLFVFNRLSAESELVVMRGAGLGPLALARPVLLLGGIACAILLFISAVVLPASSREFKDLQFEIRNHFVSSLLQEGSFTNISDALTIYLGSRNERGEAVGMLINDERDPKHSITIFAERGAFADSASGSRIILLNGNRQEFDRSTGKLSFLTFDRWTLDLDTMHDTAVGRIREPQERYLGELFFPPADLDETSRRSFLVEGHQRIAVPLSAFSFVLIPLACLLPGQMNRRGQLKRVLIAIGIAFAFQALDVAVKSLAAGHLGAIPLIYLIDLLPFALGSVMLMRGGIRLGFRRGALPAPLAS